MGESEGKVQEKSKLTRATGQPQSHWRLTEVFENGKMWRNVQALLWMALRRQAPSAQCNKTQVCPHLLFKPFCHLCADWVQHESCLHILEMIAQPPKRIKVNVLQDLQSVLSLAGYCREPLSRIKNEQNKMWGLEMWWAWLSSACVGSTMGTESGCGWKFLKISLCMSSLLFTSSTYITQCQSKSSR